ncbi:hypothetical protein BJ166DRAFT_56555 [Pestalotiopsis sp. NC0098]|nr:hypothetical protein BJ166DRAFT_56555 [Pestalotiopsis sp. NC0098]
MKHARSGQDSKAKMDSKDHGRDRHKAATTYGPGGTSETIGWSSEGAYNMSAREEELPLLKHRSPQDKAEERRRKGTKATLKRYERREECRDPATVTRSRRPSETVDPEKGKSKKTPHSQKAPTAQQRKHTRPPEGYYDRAGSLDYDLDSNDTEDCNTPEFMRSQEEYRVNVSRRCKPTDSLEEDRIRNHGRSSELLSRGQERALRKTAIQQTSLPCEDEDEDEDHDEAECHDKPAIAGRRAPSPRQEAHTNNMRQTPAEANDKLTKGRLQNRFKEKEAGSLNYHMPQGHKCLLTIRLQGSGMVCVCQLSPQGNPYTSYYPQPSVPMGQAYIAQSYGHSNQGVYQQGGTGQAHHPQQYHYWKPSRVF